MTTDELRALSERADGVEGWPATRVAEVRTRIGVRRRRRQVGAVLAAVLAVLLAISATDLVLSVARESHPPPVRQPRTLPTPPPDPTPATVQRRLVWAEGSVIHVGDRRMDVDDEVVGVAGTDDGAVYTRAGDERRATCSTTYKCGDLWFTDGTETFVIGHAYGSVIRGWQVQESASGSTVVWFEPVAGDSEDEQGEWVVYDTRLRQVSARFGSAHTQVHGVYDDVVYWSPSAKEGCLDYSRHDGGCRRFATVMRTDVAAGRSSSIAASVMYDDERHRPRSFLNPSVDGTNLSGERYDPSPYFERDGDRLVLRYGNGAPVTPRLAGTGLLRLRIPADYPDPEGTEGFGFRMWLDDDRFTIAADFRADDVLLCRVSTQRCQVLVRDHPTAYGFGGRG